MVNMRVMPVGLGPIGASIARQLVARPGFTVVGGVDVDPAKVGRDLGEVVGLGKPLRLNVRSDTTRALKECGPDIVVLSTSSSLEAVMPDVETIVTAKTALVTTTEELAYPEYAHARYTREVDALAKKYQVAVLGTGVNPGFAMDALPIALTAVCERVDRIVVNRVQDARLRRLPFQRKIGAGLTIKEFQEKVALGGVRHVGLTESVAMIAGALGWTLERITDDVQPKVASVATAGDFLAVEVEDVCGIVQDGIGYRGSEPVIHLHMEAYLGAPESFDAVDIEGVPGLSMKVTGGIQGDVATAAIVVNSIPKVLSASPGLHTMRDLPLPSFFGGR